MERRGEEKNLLLKIDGQDELNPLEPNGALDGSSGQRKARPKLSSRAPWFVAKIVPPTRPHGMSECSGWPLV